MPQPKCNNFIPALQCQNSLPFFIPPITDATTEPPFLIHYVRSHEFWPTIAYVNPCTKSLHVLDKSVPTLVRHNIKLTRFRFPWKKARSRQSRANELEMPLPHHIMSFSHMDWAQLLTQSYNTISLHYWGILQEYKAVLMRSRYHIWMHELTWERWNWLFIMISTPDGKHHQWQFSIYFWQGKLSVYILSEYFLLAQLLHINVVSLWITLDVAKWAKSFTEN